MSDAIEGYAADASDLIARYEVISFDELYGHVAHLFPGRPGRVIDIGAGSARDAARFAEMGHEVIAVEPVTAFREAGAALHPSTRITWLDDRLPDLARVDERCGQFDLVLISGVWLHLDRRERERAMPRLGELTAPLGVVIVSLRDGPGAPSRPCHPVSPVDTISGAEANGLSLTFRHEAASIQPQNRAAGVRWTWLAFVAG